MNRTATTTMYVAGAGLLAAIAFFTTPAPLTFDTFDDQGEPFYPEFTDPLQAASLEVIDYDETTGSARPFKVALRDGKWTIPSHYGYPADGEERLAATAAAVIDLQRDIVQSDRVQDHETLGVIDPIDDSTATLQGRGQRVTLREESGGVLADFVFGRPADGKDGFRYVRLPGQKRTYAVKADVDLSTRFEDWIETNLLGLESSDVSRIEIRDYTIDETTGTVDQGGNIHLFLDADAQWVLQDLPPGKTLDTRKVSALTRALQQLQLTGVRPKPASLTADLRTRDGLSIGTGTQISLQSKGFFISRDGRLLSNEGEVQVGTSQGVRYALRFGEVFYGAGLAVTAGAEDDASDDAEPEGGTENRYLFVTARFDEQLLPPRPTPPANPDDTDAAAAAGPDPTALVSADPDAIGLVQDDPPAASPTESPAGPPVEPSADEERANEYRFAVAEYEAELATWEAKADEGRAKADELNGHFAEWYYVIAGADFHDIRLNLDDLVTDAETGPDQP